jgi:hypothetical protein
MTEIPESLYNPHLHESHTYITTFTVDEGKPTEHEYDALVIDLPDILDAIAAEGLPVACPECGALSSMTIPLKDCKAWEVQSGHKPECTAVAERPDLRVLDTRAGAEPHGES